MIWTIDELIHSLQQAREQLGGDTLIQHRLFTANQIRGLSEDYAGSDLLKKLDDSTVLQSFEQELEGGWNDSTVYCEAIRKACAKRGAEWAAEQEKN